MTVPARLVAALLPLALLAACAPPAAPAAAPDFALGTADYRISRGGARWTVVGSDGARVICRRPTVEDCYWSLRIHLQAQETLDEIP